MAEKSQNISSLETDEAGVKKKTSTRRRSLVRRGSRVLSRRGSKTKLVESSSKPVNERASVSQLTSETEEFTRQFNRQLEKLHLALSGKDPVFVVNSHMNLLAKISVHLRSDEGILETVENMKHKVEEYEMVTSACTDGANNADDVPTVPLVSVGEFVDEYTNRPVLHAGEILAHISRKSFFLLNSEEDSIESQRLSNFVYPEIKDELKTKMEQKQRLNNGKSSKELCLNVLGVKVAILADAQNKRMTPEDLPALLEKERAALDKFTCDGIESGHFPLLIPSSETWADALHRLRVQQQVQAYELDIIHTSLVQIERDWLTLTEDRLLQCTVGLYSEMFEEQAQNNLSFAARCAAGDLEGVKNLLTSRNRSAQLAIMFNQEQSSPPVGGFHFACHFGHVGIVSLLLEIDQSLCRLRDDAGYAPVHHCITRSSVSHTEVLKMLYDADPSIMSDSPALLPFAAECQNLSAVEFCLNHGCDVNSQDQRGCSALHWACHSGSLQIASLLLSKGASMELHDQRQLPPLACAISTLRLDMMEFIVSSGGGPLSIAEATRLAKLANEDHLQLFLLEKLFLCAREKFKTMYRY